MTFEEKYSDEQIIKAVEECLREACIPTSAIAEKIGGSPTHVKRRLLALMKKDKLNGKMIGSSWCFRPK
jgi:DNA-binding Lrp family transcriptional regulator